MESQVHFIDQTAFRRDLLAWFRTTARRLPWRETHDPYRILLSEVMLQQTRVDQALPYYERFVARWPNLIDLASASLDNILREWEGLGYYARARNLHRAVRAVAENYGGIIPPSYERLLALPGLGPYTAAAVASIAFGEPRAVLDGNVIRVLSRVTAEPGDVRQGAVKKHLASVAGHLLDEENPGAFNEGMMELGAMVCTPRKPACADCPVRTHCVAFRSGTQDRFPVAAPKPAIPHHDIAVGLVFDSERRILIQRRPEEGMLGGLWEFPGGKREPGEALEDTCRRELREELGIEVHVGERFHRLSHAYSHFKITLHAYPCVLIDGVPRSTQPVRWVEPSQLQDFPFPRANRKLIDRLMAPAT